MIFLQQETEFFNLTGYCHMNNFAYYSIFHESESCRTSDDIASELVNILKTVKKESPSVAKIILYSDSGIAKILPRQPHKYYYSEFSATIFTSAKSRFSCA